MKRSDTSRGAPAYLFSILAILSLLVRGMIPMPMGAAPAVILAIPGAVICHTDGAPAEPDHHHGIDCDLCPLCHADVSWLMAPPPDATAILVPAAGSGAPVWRVNLGARPRAPPGTRPWPRAPPTI